MRHYPITDVTLSPGTLYLVATPLGNLSDITLRALAVLGRVHIIAAEDTRITRKLLSRYDIHTPVTSFYEGNRLHKGAALIARLQRGDTVALVSSAGTPCISDPGVSIVNEAWNRGLRVESMPGPSAVAAAVAVSGLASHNFIFLGFLSRRKKRMRDALARALSMECTVVLYESPYRIASTLREIASLAPDATAVIARELTKQFEQIIRGDIRTLSEQFSSQPPRGEMVLLVHP